MGKRVAGLWSHALAKRRRWIRCVDQGSMIRRHRYKSGLIAAALTMRMLRRGAHRSGNPNGRAIVGTANNLGYISGDCQGSAQRRRTARQHDRRSRHHRSLHRRRHFHRMRHSRFPLARRPVDPQPPDRVRRIRRQSPTRATKPGGGALRWSRPLRRPSPAAGIARWPRSTRPARSRRSSPRTSTICIRCRASRPMMSSNCTATPPMPAASAADRPMILLG